MSPELQLLTDLLAGILHGAESLRCNVRRVNWGRWARLVEAHQVGPLLADQPVSRALPEVAQQALRVEYIRNISRSARQILELETLLRDLRHLEPVVLKGGALLGMLYEEAARRVMTDLDLLIPDPDRAQEAARLLTARGYRFGKALPGHHHLSPLWHPANAIMVEIHTNLWTPPLPQEWIREIWERRVPGGMANSWVLEPASMLAHHSLHVLSDPLATPLLRNLFETAWLARRLSPDDQRRLADLARSGRIPDTAARALGLAADLLGSPALLPRPPRGALEWWARWWMEFCASESRFVHRLRHIGMIHINRVLLGANPRSPRVLLEVVRDDLRAARFARRPIPAETTWRRNPEMTTVEVGEELLLHDLISDEMHLLRDPAARLIRWLETPVRGMDLMKRLRAAGFSARATRRTLRQLQASQIILFDS